ETTVNPTEDSSESVTDWTSEPPELEEISQEELSHMLLPDSLSQLEEFGRYKRPRKTHHAHSRPRLRQHDSKLKYKDNQWLCDGGTSSNTTGTTAKTNATPRQTEAPQPAHKSQRT
ncbi:hypothetical protein M9458_017777, partial [Cirrhinus mrigala]